MAVPVDVAVQLDLQLVQRREALPVERVCLREKRGCTPFAERGTSGKGITLEEPTASLLACNVAIISTERHGHMAGRSGQATRLTT